MADRASSGRIRLTDGVIHYECSAYGNWELPLSEVRVAGEYTNQDGPFADDYFFAFVRTADEMWFEASFYAEGRDTFLQDLSSALGQPCTCSLCGSANFCSRIWWPQPLAGQPIFEFIDEGGTSQRSNQYLSGAVKAFLGPSRS